MKADDNDRLAGPRKAVNKTPRIIGVAVLAGAVAIAMFYYLNDDDGRTIPTVSGELPVLVPQIEDDVIDQAPDIPRQPLPTAEDTDVTVQPAAVELPDLANSDEFTRGVLAPLSDARALARWLSTDSLLQKAVALVDGLARGVVLIRFMPGPPPEDPFPVINEQGVIRLDEAGYARFDNYTNAITSVSPQLLASTFHTLRPLLENAYGGLGGQPEAIDNRVIAAIDRMLATPDHHGPFVLARESAYYRFADPGLEALPDVQKQLLRIGPENRRKLLNYLQSLRTALLAGESKPVD